MGLLDLSGNYTLSVTQAGNPYLDGFVYNGYENQKYLTGDSYYSLDEKKKITYERSAICIRNVSITYDDSTYDIESIKIDGQGGVWGNHFKWKRSTSYPTYPLTCRRVSTRLNTSDNAYGYYNHYVNHSKTRSWSTIQGTDSNGTPKTEGNTNCRYIDVPIANAYKNVSGSHNAMYVDASFSRTWTKDEFEEYFNNISWGSVIDIDIITQSLMQTNAYSASHWSNKNLCSASTGKISITLPSSPPVNDVLTLTYYVKGDSTKYTYQTNGNTNANEMTTWIQTTSGIKSTIVYAALSGKARGSMSRMFYETSALKEFYFNGVDMSGVTDLSYMFYHSSLPTISFKQPDKTDIDITNVTSMACMFQGSDLQSVDVSNVDPSHCVNFNSMFQGCTKLKDIVTADDALDWKIMAPANATSSAMFQLCPNLRGSIAYDANKTDLNYANTGPQAGSGKEGYFNRSLFFFNGKPVKYFYFNGIEYGSDDFTRFVFDGHEIQ